jgi:23S rRNA (cytidine1920-2'-O)/16S rRNA (cytidine1409-2'-O)-methyltransferase
MRLDRALVSRGLARSRTHAQSLIAAGTVLVNSAPGVKPATEVGEDTPITVVANDHYVSRAAHKLIGALNACAPLGLDVAGRTALDAGASTGGFTQVLLERGVAHVIAFDVGHGQLSPLIATDPRVTAIEGLNVRDLTADNIHATAELIVADLSFLSLTLAIAPLTAVAPTGADLVLMVKPQFEVGRERLGKGGVVSDPSERARAVATVTSAMTDAGATIHHISRSALPGPSGNVEFFVWGSTPWQARAGNRNQRPTLGEADVHDAIERETGGRL